MYYSHKTNYILFKNDASKNNLKILHNRLCGVLFLVKKYHLRSLMGQTGFPRVL